MKMILLLVFMAWFKTGPSVCSECSLEECKISPDWQDQLICYYEKYLFVHCSWQPYLSNTKIIGFKLHLFWPSVEKTRKPCYLINTSKTFQKIDRSNLRIYENANVWVSAFYPNSTCSRTSMFSFIPMKAVKCSPPAISGHQLSNTLILNWQSTKTLYMLRYKEISSFNWTYVNMTSPNNTVVLPKSSRSSSFSAQMRCIPDESCFHCDWGTETVIIHKLTEKPNITKIASKPLTKPPGTRTVFISWEVSQRRHVKGYEVTVESLAKNDRLKPMKSRVNTTSLEFNLAMAYFRITIFAYNDVGESPNSSVVVPDTPFTGLPGVLYATSKTKTVILTWHPVLPRKCFVIEYGMNHSDIKLLFARNRKQQYVLKGPFEVGQRYIVLLHTLKKCSTMANGSTFGMTHIYAIEGVPRKAPSNVAIHNVTQHAAAVQWAAIPEEDRLGLLRGYRIYCTESGKNTTTAFYVNYSTANSYTLTGLSENAIYRLQIAGITNAGEGARSSEQLFSTSTDDSGGMGRFIPGFGILAIPVLCAGYSMLKRRKSRICPSIPTPECSAAVQSLEGRVPRDQEERVWRQLLPGESDGDYSVCVIEEDPEAAECLNSTTRVAPDAENETMHTNTTPCDIELLDDSYIPEQTIVVEGSRAHPNIRAPNALPKNDYTTMEFIQKITQELHSQTMDICLATLEIKETRELAKETQESFHHKLDYVKQCQIQSMVFKKPTMPFEQTSQASGCQSLLLARGHSPTLETAEEAITKFECH